MSTPSTISGANGVQIRALGDSAGAWLVINDSAVLSSNGGVKLQSLSDMRLESGQQEYYSFAQRSYKTGPWYNRRSVTETRTTQNAAASPVRLAGQLIDVRSGGSLDAYATQLDVPVGAPGGAVTLTAADALGLWAVNELDFTQLDVNVKRGFVLGLYVPKRTTTVTSREVSQQLPAKLVAERVATASGWDTRLQGTVFEAGLSGASIAAGVGEHARADAQVVLEGIRRSVTTSHTRSTQYDLWQRQLGQGSTTQTLALPHFKGVTAPRFSAPGGLVVQLPEESGFKTQVSGLQTQSGLAYLNTLLQRSDVDWRQVKLAHDQWQYDQQGLTPAGAALVAYFTGGWGANALGTAGTTTAAAGATVAAGTTTTVAAGTAATTYTTAGLMANAAVSSLAAQAAISLINNQGNLGKTFQDLGSSQTVKATIAAALTAGVLDKLGATGTMTELQAKTGFSDKLTVNLINATGRAMTNTAINGGSLQDALKGALIGGLVDTAHGQAASQIKLLESDYLAHKLAHALAGCVAGAAAQGTCRDGAIGAAVGEVVAGMFKGQRPNAYASAADWAAYDAKVLVYSKLVAGAVSAFAGGDAQTAITTAETAVRNNFLTFDENQLRKEATQACKTGNAQACADEKRWDAIDNNRDTKVQSICTSAPASQECRDWRTFAALARDSYATHTSGPAAINDLLKNGSESDISELQSIQKLFATTTYAYNVSASPHLRKLVNIVADLTPIVGDVKAFYEAKDPFDYTLAAIGALGPAGDAAATAIRAAKVAHQAGNATETANQLSKAEQIAQNAISGRLFEGSGLQAMNLDKNAHRVNAVSRTGGSITIVPDATVGGIKGTFVEFKNVINISDTSQFRGYAAANQPLILVISPRTETISDTVWRMVIGTGGHVVRYDPTTGIRNLVGTRPGA